MNSIYLVKQLLEDLVSQIEQLNESDLQKLDNGSHGLAIKLVKRKVTPNNSQDLPDSTKELLTSKLQLCESRKEGLEILIESLKNKKELEQFARHLDVLVQKRDKIGEIQDKIIEATIGAVLRSNAIQGLNSTEEHGDK